MRSSVELPVDHVRMTWLVLPRQTAHAIPRRVLGVEVRLHALFQRAVHRVQCIEFGVGQREVGQSQDVEIALAWTVVTESCGADQIYACDSGRRQHFVQRGEVGIDFRGHTGWVR